ncbi:glutamate mutase subunit E [Actinocrispum wychmicini]|uniref:Glutamate mutase subunit E n=1 Tax=Actinocrispum wychmicini TaxID=1213861 RepID=A0A4R2JV48_9PSEU|nr:glutamate mutase subunit E [Actinocrispum wychmicini]
MLGGLGADAHSVGLSILRRALTEAGYRVDFLGIQNSLREFFEVAGGADVVMLSCMDGHARTYLAEFADLRTEFADIDTLWYIGGNLSVNDADRLLAELAPQGFSRVFPGYVDIPTVLSVLVEDLFVRPRKQAVIPVRRPELKTRPLPVPVDDRMSLADFRRIRREVLDTWRTGAGAADLEGNAKFLIRQPSFAQAQLSAGRVLLQPRSGVALVADQLELFKVLRDAGGDVLSYQIDSLTRSNAYDIAEQSIAESRSLCESVLNGFPMVNHGVEPLRRIISHVRTPLQTRHSTRDPRLLAEISCAGGVTGYEGGAICYNIPYFKDYPLAESLARWQYVDRLAGLYSDQFGVIIDREFFGTLTAVLIPPCLAITVTVIETLLAVGQGVRSVSLGCAEQGNRAQDIAAIRVLREFATRTLVNLGYHNVRVNTVFHQYMAAFPQDTRRAGELIVASATTAGLSGATRMLTKTPVEATRIPSAADNREGVTLSRFGLEMAQRTTVDEAAVAREERVLRLEVEQLLESVFVAGGGSLTVGVVNSFHKGLLDIPFAPSLENRGDVVTARDPSGAVRFLSVGNLQFSDEVREFHRSAMADRRRRSEWATVQHDVLQIQAGEYERWPLDG